MKNEKAIELLEDGKKPKYQKEEFGIDWYLVKKREYDQALALLREPEKPCDKCAKMRQMLSSAKNVGYCKIVHGRAFICPLDKIYNAIMEPEKPVSNLWFAKDYLQKALNRWDIDGVYWVKEALREIEKAEKPCGWIPVSERLPKEDVPKTTEVQIKVGKAIKLLRRALDYYYWGASTSGRFGWMALDILKEIRNPKKYKLPNYKPKSKPKEDVEFAKRIREEVLQLQLYDSFDSRSPDITYTEVFKLFDIIESQQSKLAEQGMKLMGFKECKPDVAEFVKDLRAGVLKPGGAILVSMKKTRELLDALHKAADIIESMEKGKDVT